MADILVTGATGRVGRALLPLLRKRGHRVRALVRSADAAAGFAAQDVESLVGDLRAPDRFADTLGAVDAVFWATWDDRDQARIDTAFLEAAAAGRSHDVRPHVVRLSAQSAGLDPPRSFGVPHFASERGLAASGLPFTILRPTLFMQSLLLFADDITRKGRFAAPAGSGRIAMVDAADVAASAAAVLGDPMPHRGRTYTLTGPEAVAFPEIAERLSAALDRRIRFSSPPGFLARIVLPLVTGMPRWYASRIVDLMTALRSGAQSEVTPDVERLTGRPPTRPDDFLTANLAAFGPRS